MLILSSMVWRIQALKSLRGMALVVLCAATKHCLRNLCQKWLAPGFLTNWDELEIEVLEAFQRSARFHRESLLPFFSSISIWRPPAATASPLALAFLASSLHAA